MAEITVFYSDRPYFRKTVIDSIINVFLGILIVYIIISIVSVLLL